MLVLSATYMSNLAELLNGALLKHLLQRTFRFLLKNGHNSPSLRTDAQILTEIYQKIF